MAKLIANELPRIYLNKALEQTEEQSEQSNRFTAKPVLTSAGSKTALIELLYALQSTGVFNNASADVKQIATYFQETFNVELGNSQ